MVNLFKKFLETQAERNSRLLGTFSAQRLMEDCGVAPEIVQAIYPGVQTMDLHGYPIETHPYFQQRVRAGDGPGMYATLQEAFRQEDRKMLREVTKRYKGVSYVQKFDRILDILTILGAGYMGITRLWGGTGADDLSETCIKAQKELKRCKRKLRQEEQEGAELRGIWPASGLTLPLLAGKKQDKSKKKSDALKEVLRVLKEVTEASVGKSYTCESVVEFLKKREPLLRHSPKKGWEPMRVKDLLNALEDYQKIMDTGSLDKIEGVLTSKVRVEAFLKGLLGNYLDWLLKDTKSPHPTWFGDHPEALQKIMKTLQPDKQAPALARAVGEVEELRKTYSKDQEELANYKQVFPTLATAENFNGLVECTKKLFPGNDAKTRCDKVQELEKWLHDETDSKSLPAALPELTEKLQKLRDIPELHAQQAPQRELNVDLDDVEMQAESQVVQGLRQQVEKLQGELQTAQGIVGRVQGACKEFSTNIMKLQGFYMSKAEAVFKQRSGMVQEQKHLILDFQTLRCDGKTVAMALSKRENLRTLLTNVYLAGKITDHSDTVQKLGWIITFYEMLTLWDIRAITDAVLSEFIDLNVGPNAKLGDIKYSDIVNEFEKIRRNALALDAKEGVIPKQIKSAADIIIPRSQVNPYPANTPGFKEKYLDFRVMVGNLEFIRDFLNPPEA